MFHFKTCHVIENPAGHAPGWNYSLVGAVPAELLDKVPATTDDVMAGRAFREGAALMAYKGRAWATVADIVEAANAAGVHNLFTSPTCACAKLLERPAKYTVEYRGLGKDGEFTWFPALDTEHEWKARRRAGAIRRTGRTVRIQGVHVSKEVA